MNLASFKASLKNENAPTEITKLLIGLWHDARGDWTKAHDIIDGLDEVGAEWAHAYLHRKEGDTWNADYWYRRAGKSRPNYSLEEEWEVIVEQYLK